MNWILPILGCVVAGAVGGALVSVGRAAWERAAIHTRLPQSGNRQVKTATLIDKHFRPLLVADLTISERKFPIHVRADLQRAISRLFRDGTTISRFCGVQQEYNFEGISFV